MLLKKKFLFFSLLIAVSCKKKHPENTVPSMAVGQNKVYFTTTDYANRTGYLYSIDTSSKNINMESPLLQGIDGVNNFQSRDNFSGNLQNLYLAKYIMGRPSSVTVYTPNGEANENTTDLPENIYDILFTNNSLYFAGYDKKEIAQSSPFLDSINLKKNTVAGFDGTQSDINNFVALLNQGDNFYALSVGYSYFSPSILGAQIYALSSNLIARSSLNPNSWTITASASTCYDVNATVKLNNHKIVVACNPGYANLTNLTANPSLFLIDVSNGIPSVTLIKIANANINFYLGGLSWDKTSVLVTEEKNNGDYNNPTVNSSYWLNILNPHNVIITSAQGGAYSVTYNNVTNSYVFSCILNTSSHCQNNAFGITYGISGSSIHADLVNIPLNNSGILNGVHGINFFKEL